MIFKGTNTNNIKSFVSYKGTPVENTGEYSFLGMILKNNGNFLQGVSNLNNKAKKVLFTIKSYMKSLGNLPVLVANNLFDALVKPISIYNSEVTFQDIYATYFKAKERAKKSSAIVDRFHFIDKTPIEKLHLHYCKYILGTRKNATNLACRAELGRLPLESSIFIQTILYLIRLTAHDINPLLKESFLL